MPLFRRSPATTCHYFGRAICHYFGHYYFGGVAPLFATISAESRHHLPLSGFQKFTEGGVCPRSCHLINPNERSALQAVAKGGVRQKMVQGHVASGAGHV